MKEQMQNRSVRVHAADHMDAVNRRVGDTLEASGWKDGEASPLSRDEKVERISVGEEKGSIEENLIQM